MTDILPLKKPDGTPFYPQTHAQAVVGLAAAILAGQVIASVNGKTGDVVLTASDVGAATQNDIAAAVSALTKSNVGLNQVDNTADTDKPVSTDQQAAIDHVQQEIPTKLSQLQNDIGAGNGSIFITSETQPSNPTDGLNWLKVVG